MEQVQCYTLAKAAEMIGVHRMTLKRWEKSGVIGPVTRHARTHTRLFTETDIARLREVKNQTYIPK